MTSFTPSQWLDLAIIVVALIAAASGARSGALGSIMSFIGVVLGAVAGVLLAPHVVDLVDGARMKLFVALFLVLALVVIGEIAGVVLGRAVRGAIRNRPLRAVDSAVGVVVQATAVLVASWLLFSSLQSSPQPTLANAVRGSQVLTEVNDLAPEWLRSVPERLSALLDTSGLPDVLEPFGQTPIVEVDPPDAALIDNPAVAATRPGVVKIRGVAEQCQRVLEGSGFVVAPNRVMSNAHVVAGAGSVTVEAEGVDYAATVVSYDPLTDLSILAVPDLGAAPLEFEFSESPTGTAAVVLGYPGGGPFTYSGARVRDTINLNGPDIYRTDTVTRQVYTIRGEVRQGNSGGPMVNEQGRVLGVVFGAAVDREDTGFVLTAGGAVREQLANVANTEPVDTQECVA